MSLMPDAEQVMAATRAPVMRISDVVASLSSAFAQAGLESPALDARLLVQHACGLRHEDLILDPGRPITPYQQGLIESYARRRMAREPVARIVGEREFWGRRFIVTPETFDPRPDTETLVACALEVLAKEQRLAAPLRILDLGTGTGCILISLLAELTQARGLGTDLSLGALEAARINALRHGAGARARFVQANWLNGIGGPFDLVVSNPPYVARRDMSALADDVRLYDPERALDGGDDGLAAYRAIIPALARVLAPGGWVILEAGHGQADAVASMLEVAGFCRAGSGGRFARDIAGIPRAVARKKHAGPESAAIKKTVGKDR